MNNQEEFSIEGFKEILDELGTRKPKTLKDILIDMLEEDDIDVDKSFKANIQYKLDLMDAEGLKHEEQCMCEIDNLMWCEHAHPACTVVEQDRIDNELDEIKEKEITQSDLSWLDNKEESNENKV